MYTEYKISGIVCGNCWGGGGGVRGYKAKSLQGDNLKELIKTAKKMLDDGSLDSGMGFESLRGAILNIETIETIEKNGKEYCNSNFERQYIGKLSEKEKKLLLDNLMNY